MCGSKLKFLSPAAGGVVGAGARKRPAYNHSTVPYLYRLLDEASWATQACAPLPAPLGDRLLGPQGAGCRHPSEHSQAVEASARRCQDAVERGRHQPAAACAGSWPMQAP